MRVSFYFKRFIILNYVHVFMYVAVYTRLQVPVEVW